MRYRKKPVVIEAYQTDKELDIETLEGTMHASVGDYIITGVRGEQYPCKPDIFEQTYEPADAPSASPWHRVEDGLPTPGTNCLVGWNSDDGFYYEDSVYGYGSDGIGFWCRKAEHDMMVEPDYWMPIEPPHGGA